MQEKESIMLVRCELKIPSLGITVRHHEANRLMPNSYPHDRIMVNFAITERNIYLGNMTHVKSIDLDRTSVSNALFQNKYNNKKLCAE